MFLSFYPVKLSESSFLPSLLLFSLFFCFLGLHLRHMEVPRLGVKSELQLLATATETGDPSHVFELHHGLRQCWIADALSKARDGTCILMDAGWIPFHCPRSCPRQELPRISFLTFTTILLTRESIVLFLSPHPSPCNHASKTVSLLKLFFQKLIQF